MQAMTGRRALLAFLTRETGILLIAGLVMHSLLKKQYRHAIVSSTAAACSTRSVPKGTAIISNHARLEVLTDEAIEFIIERFATHRSPRTLVPIWHQGGAVGRVAPEDTA